MTCYAYPAVAAVADGGRAALGVAIVGAPLLFAEPGPVVAVLLALLLIVFLGFGGVTLYRHLGRVEADAAALTVNGRRLPWPEVRAVRLAYFSTRRDRENGWFQLTVAGAAGRLTVNSALNGFPAIAKQAALAAAANGVALDAASRANFAALAIPLPAEADA